MYHMRLARPGDYLAIYKICMQPDVIEWMSFQKMNLDEFKAFFEKIVQDSEIYVAFDDDTDQVVAIRQVSFRKEPQKQHCIVFQSWGENIDYALSGDESQLYDYCIASAIKNKPEITRIEFTQSYGNDMAYQEACAKGFKVEASQPEWLSREENGGVYNLPERFFFMLLDKSIPEHIVNQGMQFTERLPPLMAYNYKKIRVVYDNGKYNCYNKKGILLGVCTLYPGQGSIKHILFISIDLANNADTELMMVCLRDIIMREKNKGIKKIELTSYDKRMLNILQKLGFYCRGEKKASIKIGNDYFNEVCADFSFFDIEDAKKILPTVKNSRKYGVNEIEQALEKCQAAIKFHLTETRSIGTYGATYLSNLAFQITRENLSNYELYSSYQAPWYTTILIDTLPKEIKLSLKNLINLVQDKPLFPMQETSFMSDIGWPMIKFIGWFFPALILASWVLNIIVPVLKENLMWWGWLLIGWIAGNYFAKKEMYHMNKSKTDDDNVDKDD